MIKIINNKNAIITPMAVLSLLFHYHYDQVWKWLYMTKPPHGAHQKKALRPQSVIVVYLLKNLYNVCVLMWSSPVVMMCSRIPACLISARGMKMQHTLFLMMSFLFLHHITWAIDINNNCEHKIRCIMLLHNNKNTTTHHALNYKQYLTMQTCHRVCFHHKYQRHTQILLIYISIYTCFAPSTTHNPYFIFQLLNTRGLNASYYSPINSQWTRQRIKNNVDWRLILKFIHHSSSFH